MNAGVAASRHFFVIFILAATLALMACQPEAKSPATQSPDRPTKTTPASGRMPETFFPERLALIGPQACTECHPHVVTDWHGTDHALANRPVEPSLDAPAFRPPREMQETGATTWLRTQGGTFIMQVDEIDGSQSTHELGGVIGVRPLRQYLTPFPHGGWQTTSAAYDPANNEWFEVFAGEGRRPGEWGHWAGQGMNWNANCAACHMTEYRKNLEPLSGRYASTWLQQGIACAQCHPGLEDHVRDARQPGYTAPESLRLSERQVMDNCASCHSRRGQLTPDAFQPGEPYADHFALALPDQPGLYHADGQIRDEVFVYGSFQMSRMGHAGVTCLDCHNPHTLQTILPAENNLLCQRCHASGLDDAPIIQPEAHSHHAAGSTGNRCVECHMPETPYMQRDPRRDHGFLSPDPLITQELGIPNACNRCHTDESVEWAVQWAEQWYGEKLAAKPQRARARALAAVHAGEDATDALLALAEKEDIAAWRGVYATLFGAQPYRPETLAYLRERLADDSPLVRSRATRALGNIPPALADVYPLLEDPTRDARLSAADAFHGRTPLPPTVAEEWRAYHEHNADRPQNAFALAEHAIAQDQPERAHTFINRALALEPASTLARQQAAVLHSQLGESARAEELLLEAMTLAPREPDLPYLLALLRAEQGRLSEAAALFEESVALDPDFYRAWYNLALARTKLGQWSAASNALDQAAPAYRQTRDWQTTRAIIDRHLADTPPGPDQR